MISRCFRFGITFVLASILNICSTSALAASGGEEALIRQGVESRRKQNDLEALGFFRRAYDLNRSPRAAAQMGLAEIALGRWVAAAGHLEEAMAASSDPWVAKHLATLKESYDRVLQRVGELEILGEPRGATIAIEGVIVGTLPLSKPLRVRSGECRFLVNAPGYDPTTRTVDVAPGQLTRETVNLAKAASSLRATNEPIVREVSGDGDQGAGAAHETRTGDASDTTVSDPAGTGAGNSPPTVSIVLASAGLVAVGAGVFFSVKTHTAGKDAANDPTFDPSADRVGQRYQTLQYVAYGVGAALIGAGIVTYVLASDRSDRSQTQVAVIPSSCGGSAVLIGRF